MIHLRRASIALAAVVLSLGSVPGIAQADTPTPSTPASPSSPSSTPSTSTSTTQPSSTNSWIRLDTLAPATVPAKGNIVISGTLHNGSGETWHDLSVMPANSYYPLSTANDLDSSSSLDPSTVHLGRPMAAFNAALSDLRPGGTTTFHIKIPRDGLVIAGAAGAYWLGVTPMIDGQPISQDLTARTYFPLLPKANKKAHLDIALVLPLRGEPLRATNGQVADPSAFTSSLSSQGRLGRIVQFAQAASGRPLTWLVDPALLDLADQTVSGVSDYGVSATGAVSAPTPTPSRSPSRTGTTNPSPSASPTNSSSNPATHAGPDVTSDQAITIRGWASSVRLLLGESTTYAVPYGDPAVGVLVGSGNGLLLRQAIEDSKQSMDSLGLGNPKIAVAPAMENLSQDAWNALAGGQTAFVNDSTSTSTRSTVSNGRTLIVASTASDGGPGPSDTKSALNIRQRLLAEASLDIGHPKTTSLTVVLPADWDPGTSAEIGSFFGPLTRPSISFTNLPAPTSSPVSMKRRTSAVSKDQGYALGAALQLQASAKRLSDLLAPDYDKTALMRQLSATEFATLSYGAAANPSAFAANAARTATSLDTLMAAVRVEGTQFVTLSGSSGVITVAIRNGLNLPITVGLRQVDQPYGSTVGVNSISPTRFDPGERTTVRLTVSAPRVSVQQVTLSAVNTAGNAVGTPLVFTLRSSPVGAVVWAVTIAIVLVLVLLASRRMRRRWKIRRPS